MTLRSSLPAIHIAALALLAGCAGTPSEPQEVTYRLPTVEQSYVIQQAPVRTVTVLPSLPADVAPYEPERYAILPDAVPGYEPTELFEVAPVEIAAAEDARREAEARRVLLDELVARVAAVRAEAVRRREEASVEPEYEGGFAPFEAVQPASVAETVTVSPGEEELAAARAAVAEAEAAAVEAEAEARRVVRERAAERAASRRDRANPPQPRRPVLGRFATRSPAPAEARIAEPAVAEARSGAPESLPAARVPAPEAVPVDVAALIDPVPGTFTAPVAPAPRTPVQAAPRPNVERAPIPGLKPWILARAPSPTAKPRRARPQRSFDVGDAAVLGDSALAPVAPADIAIPSDAETGLSTRFFPTPGKPSTLGTDRDAPLDLASIDAVPYGVGEEVQGDIAEWDDAVRLIENGEVEALAIQEDADLELTLCSGRSIVTTPPDLSAAATLTAPQIICGRNQPLQLR